MQSNAVAYRKNFNTQTEAIAFIEKKIKSNIAKKNYSKTTFRCQISRSVYVYKVEFAVRESFNIVAGTLTHTKNCKLTSLASFKIRLEKNNFPVQTEFTTSAESQRLLNDVQKPVIQKKLRLIEEPTQRRKSQEIQVKEFFSTAQHGSNLNRSSSFPSHHSSHARLDKPCFQIEKELKNA